MKFDSIVGNPPYNSSREAGKGSTNVLWTKFVNHGLEYINKDGHFLYIHPSPWRKPEHKMWPLVSKLQVEYLKMFSLKDSTKLFDVGTKVDFYCIKNSPRNSATKIVDESGIELSLDFSKLPFLPGANISFILSLLANEGEAKVNVLYDTTHHGVATKLKPEGKYVNEVVHSITKKGLKFRYSKHSEGHYGIRKVIINESGRPYPYNDYAGKCAMSQETFGVIVDTPEEADAVVRAIGSDEFYNKVVLSAKWSNFRFDYKMVKHFRKDFWKNFV
jgi:hypothetical protein